VTNESPTGTVAMYVFNDVTLDSRVRREAATLARAGYRVTVLGTTRDPMSTEIEREQVDGFEIVRVPVPREWREGWVRVIRPWSLRRPNVGLLRRSVLGGPATWPRAPRAALKILLAMAISTYRRLYLALAWRPGSNAAGREVPWPPPNWYWLALWRYATLGWCRRASELASVSEVHHGHDLTALPAARRSAARDGSPVVYDSHEIFADSGANVTRPFWARALLRWWEWRWSRQIAALISVNQADAAFIERRIQPRRTVVVHNCPERWSPPEQRSARLRNVAGVPPGAPIVLYHGAFNPNRGMEQLAEAMLAAGLETAHLVYLGYGGRRSVVDVLVADPRFGGRLHVVDAVPPGELLEMVAGADVDAIPLQHSTLNHWLSSPNKLFESLAAGVPVVVSDFPVMRGIVMDDPDGPLGAVCEPSDPGSIASALRSILERDPSAQQLLRDRCLAAARDRWNWETESRRLLDLYADLVR
jgi:glycosyltransferase involved in cell wall biosynthesis